MICPYDPPRVCPHVSLKLPTGIVCERCKIYQKAKVQKITKQADMGLSAQKEEDAE